MIIEFFLGLVTWIGQFVIGLLPEDDSDQIVQSASDALAGVVGLGSGVSVWIPWTVIVYAAGFTFTAWLALFIVKIIRQLIAHIPQFGGTG
jgi:hypothetical protein